ncbi:MAG: single-stranded-DNA-specific exonuclease RecJ [Armatimonadetes bacterium]|nr:single-stranded-DNA-specific exonuclease RecJ [Armatimonadota bacterium]
MYDASSPNVKWQIATPDQAAVDALVRALDLSPITATLLINRGVRTPEDARAFLSPDVANLSDPYRLPGMEPAVDRIASAVQNKEKIFVHGDYDADGVTAAALCVRALESLGAEVVGYVPRRSDGYDLQATGVQRAKDAGASLIMTADCGVQAVESVALAKSLGIDVVVTDHHRPGKTLPDACAIVNPYRDDDAVRDVADALSFRDFVGVAVAYKTLDAVTERVRPSARTAFRHHFLDLVALGTVQDMAPVVGENRLFVTHGLTALASSKRKGIQAILAHYDLGNATTITAEDIGYKLGPLLNAAGRMGDADLAFRLLTTRDALEAEQLTADLVGMNKLRKQEQTRITTEASVLALLPENADRRVLVLSGEAWRSGLIGVAAGNLVGLYNRPVILLGYNKERDEYHGSARGFGEFHMLNALNVCADCGMLGRYGGHSGAAGVSIKGAHFEAFRDKLHELAADTIDLSDLSATISVDIEIPDGRALTWELMDELDRLEPWGRGNEEPTFATRGVRVVSVKRVGADSNTLSLWLSLPGMAGNSKAVWFKNGAVAETLLPGDRVDIAYRPKPNEWNGNTSLDLHVKDIRPTTV